MTGGRVLIIAGSDSGGGAGVQGDIKTVTCLGGYAASAITALTAQNTLGVHAIHEVPVDFISQQMTRVLDDIGADAVKTGMLHSSAVIEEVANILRKYTMPLVVDPVMAAKGGAPLLQAQAVAALKSRLLPMAALVTPNVPEAELLSGARISGVEAMRHAARRILALGPRAVLVKGGHLESGEVLYNVLLCAETEEVFSVPRIHARHTHGTGCALASAIATGLAQGMPLRESVLRAQEYVSRAIAAAPGLGAGHGPLGHALARPAHSNSS